MKNECSLSALCEQIGIVYNSAFYKEKSAYDVNLIGEGEVREIQRAVLAGSYHLKPLKLVSLEGNDSLLKNFPALLVKLSENIYLGIYMEPSDKLVLMALGELLHHSFVSASFFHSNFFLRNSSDFVSKVVGWGKVENLLLFDFSPSLSCLSRSLLKRKVSSVVSDQAICDLILSFVDLPILDKRGNDLSKKEGIPSVPLLPEVLFNVYLDDLDRSFERHFP